MILSNLSSLENRIKPPENLPEEYFWNVSAQKYLLRQKRQKTLNFHYKSLKKRLRGIKYILNLASGNIQSLINLLNPKYPLFLINIDISSSIITHNNLLLSQSGFTSQFVEQNHWWHKNQLYVKNIHGNIQALINDPHLLTISPNSMLLCFDGFANLDLTNKTSLNNIFRFLQLFPFSFTTWLYPGPRFCFFKEKLHFYYTVVYKKHHIPLQYISCQYFCWEGKMKAVLDKSSNSFSLDIIQQIEEKVDRLIEDEEISAVQVTFFNDSPPLMKYHAFYGELSFLSTLIKPCNLKIIPLPLLEVQVKNDSFTKTFPLAFGRKGDDPN
ncbi:MAG: hypothetical protein ACFFDN_39350 [Candidatus Hodarchaeota archaeon]